MYPLSHVYVSFHVMGRMDPALALGSVLPDLLVGTGLVWRNAHHALQKEFKQHLASSSLKLGAALHGIDLPGLDYYSDVAYARGDGYAFQKARCIEEDIIHLGIDADHALWRGHNFIEMAIEVELNRQYQHLWSYLFQAKANSNLKNQVCQLAKSLKASRPHVTAQVLERFLSLQGKKEALAQDYSDKMNRLYSLSLQPQQCEAIIDRALIAIKDDYERFLRTSISSIRHSLKAFLL